MHASPPEALAPRFVLGQWCETLVATLSRAGITDLIISPGSRNTPLTLTALLSDTLRCHSEIDERSAAFFALGMAKTEQRRVALLCTSGSAGAHYLPAVTEAYYAHVPLLLITADRPAELQGIGAPQTIEQLGMFGPHVRASFQTPPPSSDPQAHRDVAEDLLRLLADSRHPVPGPVHLNVPLAKPLEPQRASTDDEHGCEAAIRRALASQSTGLFQSPAPPEEELLWLRQRLDEAERPLFTLGPIGPLIAPAVHELAKKLGVPLLTEFGSGTSNGLFEFTAEHLGNSVVPDLVVHFGKPIVSSRWAARLAEADYQLVVLPGPVFEDPSRRALRVIVGDLGAALSQLLQAPPRPRLSLDYPRRLFDVAAEVRDRLEQCLHAVSAERELSEPAAVLALLDSVSEGASLSLGNSLPIRVASWMSALTDAPLPPPYTARGTNGIDGTLATAAGVAHSLGRPHLLLIGDVAFSHDVGSLSVARKLHSPFVVAIIDNAGGRIFDHLPARGDIDDEAFQYWTTSPGLNIELACGAFGIPYSQPRSVEELHEACGRGLATSGAQVIHVRTDPQSSLRLSQAVRKGLQIS